MGCFKVNKFEKVHSGHMGIPLPNEQTGTSENSTFLILRWGGGWVKINKHLPSRAQAQMLKFLHWNSLVICAWDISR